MKFFLSPILICTALLLSTALAWSQAQVIDPGEAIGQLVYIRTTEMSEESDKFKNLNPLSIPIFEDIPKELAVVAGVIVLKDQGLASHVHIKSEARGTPNLDISKLPGAFENELFKGFKDGDWVRLVATRDNRITIEKSTEAAAERFYHAAVKKRKAVVLKSDLSTKKVFTTAELGWKDYVKVGSKAANYAELAKALNTDGRRVVRPGYAIPLAYYQEFLDLNPKIKSKIEDVLNDPLMDTVSDVSYREKSLKEIQDLILSPDSKVSQAFVDEVLTIFEGLEHKGKKRKMKLRSSTNSEDLPDFNGAGLYSSEAYKPINKEGKEKKREKKEESLVEALKTVWASVWTVRAFEERNLFRIPHAQVKMGMQVNPSYSNEAVDGVVITKNILGRADLPGPGVYIEAQRGEEHSVANPVAGARVEKILVIYDAKDPLNIASYKVHIIQRSNIADDDKTILEKDNPKATMSDAEIKDLAMLSLKATAHFKPLLGAEKSDFSLDLEFKVDTEESDMRQVCLKQARPYLN